MDTDEELSTTSFSTVSGGHETTFQIITNSTENVKEVQSTTVTQVFTSSG